MLAATPDNAKRQFERMEVPFGFWVGENDEFVIAKKAIAAPAAAPNLKGCVVRAFGLIPAHLLKRRDTPSARSKSCLV